MSLINFNTSSVNATHATQTTSSKSNSNSSSSIFTSAPSTETAGSIACSSSASGGCSFSAVC